MATAGTGYIRGVNRRLFVEAESTFGTYIALAAADAVKILEFQTKVIRKREDRDDADGGTKLLARDTVGVLDVGFTGKCYLYPANAAASMSSHGFHDLLNSLLETTASGGGYDSYDPSSVQTAIKTLTMLHVFAEATIDGDRNDIIYWSELLTGCVVNSMTFRANGANRVEVEFSGIGKSHAQAGRALILTNDGTVNVVLTEAAAANYYNTYMFQSGARVELVDAVGGVVGPPDTRFQDNSGAGFSVSSISRANDRVVLGSAPATSASATQYLQPWSPTESLPTTSPIVGVAGQVQTTEDGKIGTLPVTAVEITTERPRQAETDQFGTSEIADILQEARRSIKGTLTCRSRADFVRWLGARREFPSVDLEIDFGSTGGRYAKWRLGTVELEFSDAQIPKDAQGTITLPFTAVGTGDTQFRMY